MSVIVKGMKMPENCMNCKIKQYDEFDCVKGFWLCWDDEQEAEDCEYYKEDKWRDD